jgi:hypothetical protein
LGRGVIHTPALHFIFAEVNIVNKQEQLRKVYDILLTVLEDFVSDIADFDRLKTKVTETRERISQVIPLVPQNFRSAPSILHSFQNLDFLAYCIKTLLSSKTPSHIIYYWVGRYISTLSDILIAIDCAIDRGDDEP